MIGVHSRRFEDAAGVEQRVHVVQPAAGVAVPADDIVAPRNLLAEVDLDHVDAEREEFLVRIAPPFERRRIREIEGAGFGQWRQHIAERRGAGLHVPVDDER